MPSIPNLKDFNRSCIRVTRNSDQIGLYYEDGANGRTPFHVKTSCWTCPFGRDDGNKLVAVIPDDQYFKVEELDTLGRDVCRYFMQEAGETIPDDPDDLPYKTLFHNVDGLDVLVLPVSGQTRVFDSNGVKLTPEQINEWTSGPFSANFLLSMSLRVWGGDDSGTGKFYWSIQPVQIKIKKYCSLPEGCQIFDDEATLTEELQSRKKVQIKVRTQEEEPVADFDPDVNELLD